MSSNTVKGKPGSKWGTFISGAVAGLESRLDTILAEESTLAARQGQQSASDGRGLTVDVPQGVICICSVEHPEQLIRVADKIITPRRSIDSQNRPSASKDVSPTQLTPLDSAASQITTSLDSVASKLPSRSTTSENIKAIQQDTNVIDLSTTVQNEASNEPLLLLNNMEDGTERSDISGLEDITDIQDIVPNLTYTKDEYEKVELQRQEEMHEYLERIDALQSKLQYLAKECISSARRAMSENAGDDLVSKLAEKDEKIALLMEEGQKLSKTEVTYSGTIRALRAKSSEDGRLLVEAKRKLVQSERLATDSASRLLRLETERKESQALASRTSKEIIDTRADANSKATTIQNLKRQLQEAERKADDEGREITNKTLERERKLVQSLRDDNSNAKIEQTLRNDRARLELRTIKEDSQREQERNKGVELGLRNEVANLEGRLEILRERTEEASSGTLGDSQAKTLRQIETLQSQYAQASENWQGIESSLQSRVTALQKERDDLAKQETETRKRVRENGLAARRLQAQLDEASQASQILRHELAEREACANKLESQTSAYEKSLDEMKANNERERKAWKESLVAKIEEEKTKWQQETIQYPRPGPQSAIQSPHGSYMRKGSGLDLPSLSVRRHSNKQTSELSISAIERPHTGRRTSFMPLRSGTISPNGLEFGTPISYLHNGHLPETPSIHTIDNDEDLEMTSSPHRTVNDMISVSTAAAGPSVQLVERMSANVRRLESEKATTKDELARLSSQRDEARKEIVTLMREIDEKRAVDARLAKLEKELLDVGKNYQTTLEMLGEKSERVEELEADIGDVKAIYRDLLDKTMK